MYLANQHRQGDPPSISVDGCLTKGNKSKLLDCIGAKDIDEGDVNFDCHIIDGGTLLNTLSPAGSLTFLDFATNVFIDHLQNLSKVNNRLDLVWDEYHDASIKCGTENITRDRCKEKGNTQDKAANRKGLLLGQASQK